VFDKDFYPTPASVARRMASLLYGAKTVLEPSAGKGDLLGEDIWKGLRKPQRLDVIEKNPDLQSVLRGKGFNVVHDDFLRFEPTRMYDGIIMNPPFSEGAEHLLRAWEIMDTGRIVCLLNSQTLDNPHTKTRILLKAIVDEHGSVESLGRVFLGSERSTGVNVSLVVLKKETKVDRFGFFEELNLDTAAPDLQVGQSDGGEIGHYDRVGALTGAYDKAIDAYKEFLRAKNKVLFYSKAVASRVSEKDLLERLRHSDTDNAKFSDFADNLSASAWDNVFTESNISKFMTDGVRREFQEFQSRQHRVAFTVSNIKALINTLGRNIGSILEQAVLKTFDNLTRYDKKNTIHFEGWKSNSAWKINKRVIVPYIVEVGYDGRPAFTYHYDRKQEIHDLDKVLCQFAQKNIDDITTVIEALGRAFKSEKWGEACESEFFNIRYYKKGTIHLVFKDLELLAMFNRAAAKGKKWLPDEA